MRAAAKAAAATEVAVRAAAMAVAARAVAMAVEAKVEVRAEGAMEAAAMEACAWQSTHMNECVHGTTGV